MKLNVLEAILGDGKMASVDFITDKGKPRTINGRTGVKKFVKGRGKVNFRAKGLLNIWETVRPQDSKDELEKRYRNIRATNVVEIRAGGLVIRPSK